jgi:hypothetical protein
MYAPFPSASCDDNEPRPKLRHAPGGLEPEAVEGRAGDED